MQRVNDVARKHLGKGAKRMKESYDAKQSLIQYQPGDLVMYGTEISQLDIAPKLRVNFQGPYLVLAKLRDLDYRGQLDANGKQKFVHHGKLMPYKGEHILPWAKSALKASKSKTKLAPLARKTQENKCDLVSQSSVIDESVWLPSSDVR